MKPEDTGLTAGDWAQILGAVFIALAALAALWTVVRAERQRWDSRLPEFHIEPLVDLGEQQTRLTIANYGGPAREVHIAGVHGPFGYFGLVGPTAYWRPGEVRTVLVDIPPSRASAEVHVIVVARDLRKRHLLVATAGGATYRWPLRKAKRMSTEDVFRRLFPGGPGPLGVDSVVAYQTVARDW